MKHTAGLISHRSFVFLFSIQEQRRKSFNQCLQNFFVLFAIIKNQPIKLQMVVFVVKYGALYGGIPDSEQLGTDTIWGYPEYGASVRHLVSPGLDGLKFKDDSLLP